MNTTMQLHELWTMFLAKNPTEEQLRMALYKFTAKKGSPTWEFLSPFAEFTAVRLLKLDASVETGRLVFEVFPTLDSARFLAENSDVTANDLTTIIKWIPTDTHYENYKTVEKNPLVQWQNELYDKLTTAFPNHNSLVERCHSVIALKDKTKKMSAISELCCDYKALYQKISSQLNEHGTQKKFTPYIKALGLLLRTEQFECGDFDFLITEIAAQLSGFNSTEINFGFLWEIMHCLPVDERKNLLKILEEKISYQNDPELLAQLVEEDDSKVAAQIILDNQKIIYDRWSMFIVEHSSSRDLKKQAARIILNRTSSAEILLRLLKNFSCDSELSVEIANKLADFPAERLVLDMVKIF